jgi:hypothetical protein
VLAVPPRDDGSVAMLVWRTAQMIFREQQGLNEHRARLRADRLSPHDSLVVAYVEFLRWVARDYFLTAADVDVRGVCFEARSGPLRERATDLCRLADPRAAEITDGTWRSSGGVAQLSAEALALLAAGDVVPRDGPGALPADVPVRCGRAEAYRCARQRQQDLFGDGPYR